MKAHKSVEIIEIETLSTHEYNIAHINPFQKLN